MSSPAAPTPAREVSVSTSSEDQTEELGRVLGAALPTESVVGLSGPLGCGKTCLTRGIAEALGLSPRDVASPSFVYLVEYPEARPALSHADLYRLAHLSADDRATAFESIGLYASMEQGGVTVVEWWDSYTGNLPQRLVRVEFTIENVNDRSIKLSFSGNGLDLAAAAVATLSS